MSLCEPDARKVVQLLVSMNDYLPTPQSPRFYKSAAVGPQASAYKQCETCRGCGRVDRGMPCPICGPIWKQEGRRLVRPRHGCRACPVCENAGEVRAPASEQNFERYSNLPISELEKDINAAREDEMRIRHKHELNREVGGTSEDELLWVKERNRYYDAGDYDRLNESLKLLRQEFPLRYEMLAHWVSAVDDSWWSWSPEAERGVAQIANWLASRMPEKIRVPSWVARRFVQRAA